mmetsp:Transcript_29179/g.54628  ORF Transcript_29179/g.54628 Transcript_29179/m.54628 type:complete len:205 (-) Transcript_29179:870-1484(-)
MPRRAPTLLVKLHWRATSSTLRYIHNTQRAQRRGSSGCFAELKFRARWADAEAKFNHHLSASHPNINNGGGRALNNRLDRFDEIRNAGDLFVVHLQDVILRLKQTLSRGPRGHLDDDDARHRRIETQPRVERRAHLAKGGALERISLVFDNQDLFLVLLPFPYPQRTLHVLCAAPSHLEPHVFSDFLEADHHQEPVRVADGTIP